MAAAVQLAVANLLAVPRHRHGVGGLPDLGFEQLVDAHVVAVRGLRIVPLHQQPASLRVGQQRQLADPLPGIGRNSLEQRLKVPQHPLDRLPFEQVGIVFQHPAELFAIDHPESQVEFRRMVFQGHSGHSQPRDLRGLVRGVLGINIT